jgi:hypothetical protein
MNILIIIPGFLAGLCVLLALSWLFMSPAKKQFLREQMKALPRLRARYHV